MRKVFVLRIEVENAAFDEAPREYEVARLLRETADGIEGGFNQMQLVDHNGNRVGWAEFTEEGGL